MNPRNVSCSFCRKGPTDVGPLVEGPGEVYICGACVELCQSILDQERSRRNPPAPPVGPTLLRETLDTVVSGQDEAEWWWSRSRFQNVPTPPLCFSS